MDIKNIVLAVIFSIAILLIGLFLSGLIVEQYINSGAINVSELPTTYI